MTRRARFTVGRRVAAAAVVAAVLPSAAGAAAGPQQQIAAYFRARSYAPGAAAALVVRGGLGWVRLALCHAGAGPTFTRRNDVMLGRCGRATVAAVRGGQVRVRVPRAVSGLWFARLRRRGRVGYAPFVLRPARLGEARVAVVLPTNTWAAYNFRDDDGDGIGDTWYASPSIHRVELARPFLDNGVPPHYRGYDAGFLHWLVHGGRRADVLSDDDLEAIASGDRLAQLYDLVVFPGHEEYVTEHVYDVVTRYRDLGGNLAFLSANDFFYRVRRDGSALLGRDRWRDLGRPESRLVGVQYVDWNHDRFPNRPYVVTSTRAAPWLFAGTGLRDGSSFGSYGIEIDARTRDSPPGVKVLARIADAFGPGKSAEMAYYETPRGAKVFAAGTINFGGSAWFPVPARMIANVWDRLSRP